MPPIAAHRAKKKATYKQGTPERCNFASNMNLSNLPDASPSKPEFGLDCGPITPFQNNWTSLRSAAITAIRIQPGGGYWYLC